MNELTQKMNLKSILYRKNEKEKIKNRKKKCLSISDERNNTKEGRNENSSNILYKGKGNNSIDRINTSKLRNRFKKRDIDNYNTKNLLYDNLTSSLPFYHINFNDLKYDLNEIIYFNDNCTLYKGKYFHNDVCIKEINNINYLSESEIDKIKNEINISTLLHHKNIVNTMGYSFNEKKTKIFIISEYMKNKSLKSFIDSNKGNIPLNQKLLFIYEISLAIEFMHSRNYNILHRDIKSSNVLLDDNFHCKLCDFGMSKYYNCKNEFNSKKEDALNINTNYKTNSQSTLFWMSPEYLCDGIINEKSDIYSFGILTWEIFMEDTSPYKNININDYLLGNKEIVYNKRPIIDDKYFEECPKIKDLMQRMWSQDYNQRPDISSIIDELEDLNQKFSFLK